MSWNVYVKHWLATTFMTMLSSSSWLFLVSESAHACIADGHQDQVKTFPGWNDMPLPSAWYSGYLDYELEGQQVHTHYVLVQAEEDHDATKPLLYWSNGGPGASSLFGLLTELGPLLFSDDSLKTDDYAQTGIPTPIYNPHSWTKFGSILIFDQPAPIGFSYCNDEYDSHSCGGIAWTDELASLNAFTAFEAFFTKHPCYQTKDLYLTGESYAGIYIPTLARRMLQDIDTKGDKSLFKNLLGFAVGDGCLGTETDLCRIIDDEDYIDFWLIMFLAGHGQMPLSSYRALMKACHEHLEDGNYKTNEECKKQVEKVTAQVGNVFAYGLYDDCTYENGLLQSSTKGYACGGSNVMREYFNQTAARYAFHLESTYFAVDNAEGDFDYTPTEKNLMPFYQSVNGRLRVLVYNGDTDPAITSFATESWTSRLGFDELNDGWRPWTLDNCQRMGGYVTQYNGMFDYVTIRGAGHLVPTYKPEAAFKMIESWLSNTDYPYWDKTCKKPDEKEEVMMMIESSSSPDDDVAKNPNLGVGLLRMTRSD